MNRTRPYLNKYIKQKQLQITDTYHNLNMKEIKPITSRLMEHTDNIIINNSKREKIKEVREIQIQRQNRSLMQKISSTMSKKSNYSKPISKNIRTKVNKSLNQIFRRKQEESITQENKKFLLRLQSKKPTMNLQQLNKDWKDNKSVIKRMANFEFYLTTYKSKDNHHLNRTGFNSQRTLKHKIESIKLQKTKMIDGHKMLIKLFFQDGFLKIIADMLDNKSLKVIEIPKEEAIIMIEQDCQGSVQKLIRRLRYNSYNDTLFIISNTLQENHEEFNPENEQLKSQKNELNKSQIQNHSIAINLKDKKASIEPSQHLEQSKNKSTIKSNKHESLQQKVEASSPKIEPQEEKFQQEEQQSPPIKDDHNSIVPHDEALVQQKELPLEGKKIAVQLEQAENYQEQFQQIDPQAKQAEPASSSPSNN